VDVGHRWLDESNIRLRRRQSPLRMMLIKFPNAVPRSQIPGTGSLRAFAREAETGNGPCKRCAWVSRTKSLLVTSIKGLSQGVHLEQQRRYMSGSGLGSTRSHRLR
jgi:hypothetical protein